MNFLSKLWNDFIAQNFPLRFYSMYNPHARTAVQVWHDNGGDKAKHAFWLFAAPVHLVATQDSFYLAEPAPILTTRAETEALLLILNQHFNDQQLFFYCQNEFEYQNNTWFCGCETQPLIKTTRIEDVKNKNVANFLPSGAHALQWAKIQNEIQMLLFEHPVNLAREKQGLPVINSLWFYGLSSSLGA